MGLFHGKFGMCIIIIVKYKIRNIIEISYLTYLYNNNNNNNKCELI